MERAINYKTHILIGVRDNGGLIIAALVVELGLHRLKEISVQDGGLLARKHLTPIDFGSLDLGGIRIDGDSPALCGLALVDLNPAAAGPGTDGPKWPLNRSIALPQRAWRSIMIWFQVRVLPGPPPNSYLIDCYKVFWMTPAPLGQVRE
jgi:hypothetical protein